MYICHLIVLEKYGIPCPEYDGWCGEKSWYKSDLIRTPSHLLQLMSVGWKAPVRAFFNLMSGHLSWVSHWPSPAFSASDWLMEGELISGDSIMSAINCSPLLASQTPWRTTGVVRKPHSLFKVLFQITWEYQTLSHLFRSDCVCSLVLKWMSWKLILYKIWLRYDSFKVTTRNESSKSEWGYLSAHVSVEYNLLSWPC